jgi:enediyne biosynthesis protein E4
MSMTIRTSIFGVLFLVVGSASFTQAAEPVFRFRDVTKSTGLASQLKGINGHGVGWGDLDNDGWPEIYVGTFDKSGNFPGALFWQKNGKFQKDKQPVTRTTGRANSILFVDFDNDGDLDLYQSNLGGGKRGYAATDSKLLRNDGKGVLVDVSKISGACPAGFRGRGATVLDFDGDADLDLLIGEAVHYGSGKRCRLLRNDGRLKFTDVSDEVGIPTNMPGLGVAAGDLNNDGWPDIFFAARGANRLFLNNTKGKFVEHSQSPKLFEFEYSDGDDTPCGVCFSDVNLDGLQDIVVGQHYDRPWVNPIPIRLYLNRGIKAGNPKFDDVTQQAGLVPLFLKAPHIEVQDFDNDGIPDIQTSIVKYDGDNVHPIIFRGVGSKGGIPRFELDGWDVNDYPTPQDRTVRRSGEFFKKVLEDHKVIYTAPAPTCDFNRDGRLDIFLANWFAESSSLLLQNEHSDNRWLRVQLNCVSGINRMGVGCVIRVYEAGHFGDATRLIGSKEIAVGYGYASGQEAIAHFGMSDHKACDIEIQFPHGLGVVQHKAVPTNQVFKTNLAAQRLRLRASNQQHNN